MNKLILFTNLTDDELMNNLLSKMTVTERRDIVGYSRDEVLELCADAFNKGQESAINNNNTWSDWKKENLPI